MQRTTRAFAFKSAIDKLEAELFILSSRLHRHRETRHVWTARKPQLASPSNALRHFYNIINKPFRRSWISRSFVVGLRHMFRSPKLLFEHMFKRRMCACSFYKWRAYFCVDVMRVRGRRVHTLSDDDAKGKNCLNCSDPWSTDYWSQSKRSQISLLVIHLTANKLKLRLIFIWLSVQCRKSRLKCREILLIDSGDFISVLVSCQISTTAVHLWSVHFENRSSCPSRFRAIRCQTNYKYQPVMCH